MLACHWRGDSGRARLRVARFAAHSPVERQAVNRRPPLVRLRSPAPSPHGSSPWACLAGASTFAAGGPHGPLASPRALGGQASRAGARGMRVCAALADAVLNAP